MTAQGALRDKIADALAQFAVHDNPHSLSIGIDRAHEAADAVLAVLDADQVTTAEELKALPVGSVILSRHGTVAHKQNASETPWVLADDVREYWTDIGLIDCLVWPFTVLHRPEGEEQ